MRSQNSDQLVQEYQSKKSGCAGGSNGTFFGNGEFALGLSTPVKSHTVAPKPPEQRERKGSGMTAYARRMVRNGAWELQRMFSKFSLSFLTCTIPSEVLKVMEASGESSEMYSEMVRQYKQWLERRLRKANLCHFVVGVNEIQDKRYKKYGEVAPHLHWTFQGRKSKKAFWVIRPDEFSKHWLKVIFNVTGVEVQTKSATRVEQIKYSIENYLSKYMTKGGEVVEQIIKDGKRDLLPTSWWTMTDELRNLIKSKFIKPCQEAVDTLYRMREELKEKGIIQWYYVHEIEIFEPHGESWKMPVAFCGKFAKPEYREMFVYGSG